MKYFVTILLLTLLATTSNAQIQFTADEFLAAYSKLGNAGVNSFSTTAKDGLGAVAKTNGAGVTWDFTGANISFQPDPLPPFQVLPVSSDDPLANDPAFSSATHVIKLAPNASSTFASYQYLRFDQTGLYVLGMANDSAGGTKLLVYNPAQQKYKFPLQYTNSWQSASTIQLQSQFGQISAPDTLTVTVDGYGSLVTPTSIKAKGGSPMSSSNDALGISYQDVIFVPGFTITQYYHEYLSKSDHFARIDEDKDQKPTKATYFSPAGGSGVYDLITPDNSLHLNLSNNPASNIETKISFQLKNSLNAQVIMMDALGNKVQMIHNGPAEEGQNIIPIDISKLSAGAYFIRVTADGITETRKLIIAK